MGTWTLEASYYFIYGYSNQIVVETKCTMKAQENLYNLEIIAALFGTYSLKSIICNNKKKKVIDPTIESRTIASNRSAYNVATAG